MKLYYTIDNNSSQLVYRILNNVVKPFNKMFEGCKSMFSNIWVKSWIKGHIIHQLGSAVYQAWIESVRIGCATRLVDSMHLNPGFPAKYTIRNHPWAGEDLSLKIDERDQTKWICILEL